MMKLCVRLENNCQDGRIRCSRYKAAFALLALAIYAAKAPAQPAPPPFFFKDGDRAMILGDSITQQLQYSTLIESYVLSRFPRWNITFRNLGWSGDRMTLTMRENQETGFARDLAPLNPTAVTIDFGMNDGRSGESGIPTYVAAAQKLDDKFAALGTRVAFLTSSAEERYEAGQPAGSAYNIILRKYSDALKGVAAEKNAVFVDQLNPMIQTIESGRTAGVLASVPGGVRLIPDGIHPGWGGHLIMAAHILKGLNAPQLVSRVELDAQNGKTGVYGCQVSQVMLGPVISFARLDEALPWPLPPDSLMALKIPGFDPLNDLSRFDLQVANLPSPLYDVAIDGAKIGTFSREDLAYGLNLTQNAGPINEQGQAVLNKIIEKNKIFFTRWREVQVGKFPDWIPKEAVDAARPGEMARLDGLIVAAEAEIKKLSQPKLHVWTLSPAVAPGTETR